MPCNCGNNKDYRYIYTDANGRQTSWDTKIEAEAAKIRAGGGGSIRAEAK